MTRNMAVSRSKADIGNEAGLTNALLATAATVGVVVAGAALLELALIPGVLIGGTAVLAPQYLPKLGRGVRSLLNSSFWQRAEPGVRHCRSAPTSRRRSPPPQVKRAIAKTITFRIIVTTLDFSVNYVVLGELATAAGLSAFALVAGPLFYLGHETAWNYLGASDGHVDLTVVLPLRPDAEAPATAPGGFDDQPCVGQDDHLSHHRDGRGLHDQLRGRRRSRDRGGAVGFRLHPRSLCLSRPRDGLGPLWLARRAPA